MWHNLYEYLVSCPHSCAVESKLVKQKLLLKVTYEYLNKEAVAKLVYQHKLLAIREVLYLARLCYFTQFVKEHHKFIKNNEWFDHFLTGVLFNLFLKIKIIAIQLLAFLWVLRVTYSNKSYLLWQHWQVEQELANNIDSVVRLQNQKPSYFFVLDLELVNSKLSEVSFIKGPLLDLLLLQKLKDD